MNSKCCLWIDHYWFRKKGISMKITGTIFVSMKHKRTSLTIKSLLAQQKPLLWIKFTSIFVWFYCDYLHNRMHQLNLLRTTDEYWYLWVVAFVAECQYWDSASCRSGWVYYSKNGANDSPLFISFSGFVAKNIWLTINH